MSEQIDPREVLRHMVTYLRRAMFADANLSWALYKTNFGDVPVVTDALQAGDLLRAADIVEQGLLKR